MEGIEETVRLVWAVSSDATVNGDHKGLREADAWEVGTDLWELSESISTTTAESLTRKCNR
jgi:hypothetical protein